MGLLAEQSRCEHGELTMGNEITSSPSCSQIVACLYVDHLSGEVVSAPFLTDCRCVYVEGLLLVVELSLGG